MQERKCSLTLYGKARIAVAFHSASFLLQYHHNTFSRKKQYFTTESNISGRNAKYGDEMHFFDAEMQPAIRSGRLHFVVKNAHFVCDKLDKQDSGVL